LPILSLRRPSCADSWLPTLTLRDGGYYLEGNAGIAQLMDCIELAYGDNANGGSEEEPEA